MAFKLGKSDRRKLYALLGKLVDGHKCGDYSREETVGILAHVIAAGAIDNEISFKAWLQPDALKVWERTGEFTGTKGKTTKK
jgi:hypothetical protein